MGSMSIWHWILVLAVGLLLFGGRGKISELMGDFAKGIKSFKKGLTEEEKAETEPVKTDLRMRGSEGGLRAARLSELKPPCSRSVGASSCSSASSR